MDEKKGRALGTQSASKVLALLKIVGARHPDGVRLKELILESGFDRSTTHRLLTCLMQEGFVERTVPHKLYRLDMEAMQLGLVSAGMVVVVERYRSVMQRIARSTGDTVFLILRTGDHALCLHREEGSYPIKAFVVAPGTQRLLGFSSVGIAVLAGLPDAETVAHHHRHASGYARLGLADLRILNDCLGMKTFGDTDEALSRLLTYDFTPAQQARLDKINTMLGLENEEALPVLEDALAAHGISALDFLKTGASRMAGPRVAANDPVVALSPRIDRSGPVPA